MDRTRHLVISSLLLTTLGLAAYGAFLRRVPPLPRLGPGCAVVESSAAGEPGRLVCEGVVAARRGSEPNELETGRQSGACVVEAGPTDQATVFAMGMPMDICLATEAELRMLPGIGAARARAIASYREEQGLEGLDDLVGVVGIGPGTVRRLKRFVAPQCKFMGEGPRAASSRARAPN